MLTLTPGNKPASVRPRNHLAAMRPDQLVTNPIPSMHAPQKTLSFESAHDASIAWFETSGRGWGEAHIIIGIKIDGRSFFRRMLVRGSNTAYETKKMVNVAL